MKKIILLLTLFITIASFSQQISRQKGRFFVNGKQISTRETKQLLASNAEALALFKAGKSRESTGGLLLGLGAAAVTVDLAIGLFSDVKYPSVATYIGAATIITAIPLLSGKNKKIDEGIDRYNQGLKNLGENDPDVELNVIANHYGYGLQFRF